MTFDAGDVVVVPFPFTDRVAAKRRPALVLSQDESFGAAGHGVMAMIISARHSRWPLDVEIVDRQSAGLTVPCLVRMKLFTLDHRFVERRMGRLGSADRANVTKALSALLTI